MFILLCFFIIYSNILVSDAFQGLTLITSMNKNGNQDTVDYTHLINNEGQIINEWIHDTSPASIAYLTRDSILYVPCKVNDSNDGPYGGRFKKMNWRGEIIWDYTLPSSICVPHHDIEVLPNGNILAICEEFKTYEDVLTKGKINPSNMSLDMIVEIEPVSDHDANIVWEWHFWDRLIQDINPELENFMNISNNPHKMNINCEQGSNTSLIDWNHCNSISYNEELDQILISSRRSNEIYIIDHSILNEETHLDYGGLYGRGGDFLYRWGNTRNYINSHENISQNLFAPHSATWVKDDQSGDYNILIFNNNHIQGLNSAIVEISPSFSDIGYLFSEVGFFLPSHYDWVFIDDFFSPIQSGALRLPNGNTLVTVTTMEHIFEIDNNFNIVWEYDGILRNIARALKYPINYLEKDYLGDVNFDSTVNVLDVIIIVNFVLEGIYNNVADLNYDQNLNVLDIVILVEQILN